MITPTHAELIAAAVAIGRIAECSEWYTSGLADRIEATGKRVADMTVAELVALDNELRAEIVTNEKHK